METGWLVWGALVLAGAVLLRWLVEPLRYLGLLAGRMALGYLCLWALNLVGLAAGFHLPLNPVTGLVVGVLGLPGLATVYLLHRLYS
ncbi:MAG: pro-sigmaK processing inhibitor BofA family protein [Firmicutes bacterium]|nr:pro-sigmaK processing inhibitor BofA family protein [Bacillota bacterium]